MMSMLHLLNKVAKNIGGKIVKNFKRKNKK